MTRSKTYTPELREEAVKLVLTQGLTLEDAAVRLTIPKGTLANWWWLQGTVHRRKWPLVAAPFLNLKPRSPSCAKSSQRPAWSAIS